MTISREQLKKAMPHLTTAKIDQFYQPLCEAMQEFGITNPYRQAAFLAQIAHESAELHYVRELASGAAYDTGRLAERLGNTPQKDGDGEFYKGRGLIQITGHTNYVECGEALHLDLVHHPELLERPLHACRSAAWFWQKHGLNELADQHTLDAFRHITRRINGGYNGEDDREGFWKRACVALGLKSPF